MKVRDIIKMLEEDGWYLSSIEGSHRQFKHPLKRGKTTVVGKESKDMPIDLLRSVFYQAQIDWKKRK